MDCKNYQHPTSIIKKLCIVLDHVLAHVKPWRGEERSQEFCRGKGDE